MLNLSVSTVTVNQGSPGFEGEYFLTLGIVCGARQMTQIRQ